MEKKFFQEGSDDNIKLWWRFIGFILMVIGIFTIMYCMFFYSGDEMEKAGGSIALAFFILILGFVFMFPSILSEDGVTMSTMRLIGFIVISIFAMMVIKIGWEADSFEKLKIDASWATIIGLAFGAKAAQKYFEYKMGVKGKKGNG